MVIGVTRTGLLTRLKTVRIRTPTRIQLTGSVLLTLKVTCGAPGEAVKIVHGAHQRRRLQKARDRDTGCEKSDGGTSLGYPSMATLTITDDETVNGTTNPIDENAIFVAQHYHDFLNREPDAQGLQFWIGQLQMCGSDPVCLDDRRENVSAAFFLSIEFQKTGFLVVRMYKASFPDSTVRPRGLPRFAEFLRDTQEVGRGIVVGQVNWEQDLANNLLTFARAWVQRSDFLVNFPNSMTAASYVDGLFANLQVVPTTAERNAAIAAFGPGDVNGRADALLSVINSGSVYNRQYNAAIVLINTPT